MVLKLPLWQFEKVVIENCYQVVLLSADTLQTGTNIYQLLDQAQVPSYCNVRLFFVRS